MASYILYSALIIPQITSQTSPLLKHVLIAIHHNPLMKKCMVLEMPDSSPWMRKMTNEVKKCVLDIHFVDRFGREFSRLWNCQLISNPFGAMKMPDVETLAEGGMWAYILNFPSCFADMPPQVLQLRSLKKEEEKEEKGHYLAYLLPDDPFGMKSRSNRY